ncbi:hypothetical protein Amsp01_044310 [Amycolatopsis sp. NBRC 101858]|uniref:PP_RS20740 family protein n=1 Tax=Amycolatopsis sp. NBRC 101858 TaxID=3032200 RepID=UPI0024A1D6D9|nr:hypothetical protein [Amycolatopsis sp. NBRC 101858]GLY38407.1 hypothetical protein Amsp01_044310 [Amycolatopsis sp. NBRC 101858]
MSGADEVEGDRFSPPEDFSSEDIGQKPYVQPERSSARGFEAWHKPRKQYVRDNQWAVCIEQLCELRKDVRELRYLGLPGVDMLDLRYFQSDVLAPKELGLSFLGVDRDFGKSNSNGTDMDVSFQEVKMLEGIDPQSEIIPGDIRDLGIEKSTNHQNIRRRVPFDIVNLDMCDHLLLSPADRDKSIYSMLRNLFSLQDRQDQPWVLFLTTRVSKTRVDQEALRVLVTDLSAAMRDAGIDEFDLDHLVQDGVNLAGVDDSEFFLWSLMGFCHWLRNIAQSRMPCNVRLNRVFTYSVDYFSQFPDMVSLAFQVAPKVTMAHDPSGLASAVNAPKQDNAASLNAYRKKLIEAVNVDVVLGQDRTACDKSIQDAADLMLQARYDWEKYVEWAYETVERHYPGQ